MSCAPPLSDRRVAADVYSVEVDTIDETEWHAVFREFSDANIYQTWPYGVARSGRAGLSHLVLRRGPEVVAIAQARLAQIPWLNLKIAYVFWGPLWKRIGTPDDFEVLRRIVHALKTEYIDRRKMVVRIVPNMAEDENGLIKRFFVEAGFGRQRSTKRRRTIVMDIRPPLEQLSKGLHQKWRNCLNKARRQNLNLIEGEDDALFDAFEGIYAEMVDRKQFADSALPPQFRTIQTELSPEEKLRVFLCQNESGLSAGGICSACGDTALYLFGATTNRGTQDSASYLVHWRMLEWAKSRGCKFYDLNGINPSTNPGVYKFKSRFAGRHGREIETLGVFDGFPNPMVRMMFSLAEQCRTTFQRVSTSRLRAWH